MQAGKKAMELGLGFIGRLSRASVVDKLGLRKTVEQGVYHSTKNGFIAASAAARGFKKLSQLTQPARLSAPSSGSSLFDISPSDEQQMLRDTVASFASEQLRPAAVQADHDCAAKPELLKSASELGVGLMGIPEALGGAGAERSAMTNVLVAEAMAQGDMGLAVACLAPTAVSTALVLWGDEGQQDTYLREFAGENPPAAALALMEPRPLFNPLLPQVTARKSGTGYVLNGIKSLVPRANEAELFVISAHVEGEGAALFIVESNTPGISLAAEPSMGLRAAALHTVQLKSVAVPGSARLGSIEDHAECVQLARLGWCALAVGTAQAALDYLIPYVNERVAFGEPISHRQSVAFAVANVGIELEGMRLATYRAASRAERGDDFVRETALARRLCADKGAVIGSDAVQLLGGHGFVKEHPAERWYRDLRAVGLMEGVVLV